MKFDQLAFVSVHNEQEKRLKIMLGLTKEEDWVVDNVKMKSWVAPDLFGEATARLQFHIMENGMQLEILRFTGGINWVDSHIDKSFGGLLTAHHGFHLDEGEPWPELPGGRLVQITRTQQHSVAHLNEGAAAGRTYEYRIYHVGFNLFWKFIRRIPKEQRFMNIPEVLK